ncbi:LINE-1 retrotransposable element orf2 protein [Plakobranchus ocellatus]|uniref:LINE-1 retrotransposable element orf2 protein n=1 Tax=Plakobranchus ocellatus TaxID=259542 RepID=A0AAV4AHU6_9GAST|nr:LINE-1 retrotransposable element orf2 protein [Plakobranchus ocellatus]
MFKAIKIINKKRLDNPKINDEEGKHVTNPKLIKQIITEHFQSKFRDEDNEDIEPFKGEPRPLSKIITSNEVRECINKLNNGRAPGKDNICNEYLKHAPPVIDEQIANIFNKTFESHEHLGINEGLLITIPKPGKPKGPPSNLRPKTLLNSVRQVLSTIVLNRIRPRVEKYVSNSQSGFRPNRSTSDVIWAHRWITAKVLNATEVKVNITGIDMSATFDTINRTKLLEILRDLIDEDELRIIRFLLSETTIDVKINEANDPMPFTTNIGTPQGDSLSPVLFIVNLEHALRDIRPVQNDKQEPVPAEIIYADDIDFIGKKDADVNSIEKTLKTHCLKVNVDNTEHTSVRKDSED